MLRVHCFIVSIFFLSCVYLFKYQVDFSIINQPCSTYYMCKYVYYMQFYSCGLAHVLVVVVCVLCVCKSTCVRTIYAYIACVALLDALHVPITVVVT